MAIPSDPTVTDIVTEGLKRGGRVSPSATDLTNASTIYLQEVKADLYLKAPRHRSLITQYAIGTTVGVSRYTWPTEAEAIRSVQLIDTPSSGYYTGTAQSGGSATITLDANFTEDTANMIGKFVFICSGTGAGQFAQIIDYDNSTKVVTIESNWSSLRSTWVSPDNTSVYLVESSRKKLWDYSKPWMWDLITTPYTSGTPTWATINNRQIWLDHAPDRQYVLFIEYWQALDQLDESLSAFTGHLRKFRNLWTQGIAVKVMQRFDEDRYLSEMNIYNTMLDLYGAETAAVGQVVFQDA